MVGVQYRVITCDQRRKFTSQSYVRFSSHVTGIVRFHVATTMISHVRDDKVWYDLATWMGCKYRLHGI